MIDELKKYRLIHSYETLFKGIGAFSIGVLAIGLVQSNESKDNVIYIIVGVMCVVYGVYEGMKGLSIIKNL